MIFVDMNVGTGVVQKEKREKCNRAKEKHGSVQARACLRNLGLFYVTTEDYMPFSVFQHLMRTALTQVTFLFI